MIYIIQCLCPNRHCIMALAYDPDDIAHDVVLAGLQELVGIWIERGKINPWCGICNSHHWTYEQRRTKYKTMAEAKPELQRLELEQAATRAMIDQRKAERN